MAPRCLRCHHSPILAHIRLSRLILSLERRTIAPAIQLARWYASQSSPGMPPTPTPFKPRRAKHAPVKQTATLEPSPIFASFNLPKFDPTKNLPVQKKKVAKQKSKMPDGKRRRKREEASKRLQAEDPKSYTYKSLFLKTSVKKLGNLARQIAHKDIDHAITQMRFSPKRVAQSILRNLEHAKEEAIRLRAMNDGKIIVDQAWVGRGPFMKQFWPRARGRINVRMRPRTSFTVLLRTSDEVGDRVEKVRVRKMWRQVKPMSDRKPIYNPRPYYTW